jgi:hypothetical protein
MKVLRDTYIDENVELSFYFLSDVMLLICLHVLGVIYACGVT